MHSAIDKKNFGPWALITGASSGIGKGFARRLGAAGFNVVLVARQEKLLEEVGSQLAQDYGVEYRTVVADLSVPGFLENVVQTTGDLDIGLVISNAGTGNPGEFLSLDRQELQALLRLNTMSHLDIAHHFGKKLTARGKGGLLFVGALGSMMANPYMANDVAAKSYVMILGQSLHDAWQKLGVHVCVLLPGAIDTPVLTKFGFDPATMPMKPMSVEQCVEEGLAALQANRSLCIPGRMNRIMFKLMPRSILKKMIGKMFEKAVISRSSPRNSM